jgi:hypothetical protein
LGGIEAFLKNLGHSLPQGTTTEIDYKIRDESPYERFQHAGVRADMLRQLLADVAADLNPEQRIRAIKAAEQE